MPTEAAARTRAEASSAKAPRDNLLVLASVTAVLKNLLENGLVSRGVTANIGGDTVISALPPDRIKTGEEEKAGLNLFLYRVAPRGLYSQVRVAPEDRAKQGRGHSVCLELHYLLTAYGAQDFHTEILLGYAMDLLYANPVLTGDAVRKRLAAVSSMEGGRVVLPALVALASSELADRINEIKISPQVSNSEDLSRLWSSLQARFRPSVAYKILVSFDEAPGEST